LTCDPAWAVPGRLWAAGAELPSRSKTVNQAHQAPGKGKGVSAPGPVRTELFPVFPVKSRLLPVRLVTIFLNDDNELRRFRRFVTGVPYKLKRHPEADRVNRPPARPETERFAAFSWP
jgi:hypothetical protein